MEDNEEKEQTIIMRHESFLLMLDFTDFKEKEEAHFLIAFGKEQIFHSQFYSDVWNFDNSGFIDQTDWNGLKERINDVFVESWEMGALYDLEAMKREFNRIYNDKIIMNMLDE